MLISMLNGFTPGTWISETHFGARLLVQLVVRRRLSLARAHFLAWRMEAQSTPTPFATLTMKSCALVTMLIALSEPRSASLLTTNSEMSML